MTKQEALNLLENGTESQIIALSDEINDAMRRTDATDCSAWSLKRTERRIRGANSRSAALPPTEVSRDRNEHHPDCPAAYFGFKPGVTCSCGDEREPFGPDWVKRKIEESERGFGRKS